MKKESGPTPTRAFIPLALAFVTLLPGCLVTRAQLKAENSDQSQPSPAKIQEVEPQGRYVIDEIKGELTRLNGRIEDMERAQKEATPSAGEEQQQKNLEKRLIELEQSQIAILEALKKLQETSAATSTVDPMDLFNRGFAEFEAKKFDSAVVLFSNYLKNPKATAAQERATFLRGEAYYQLKQYKKAIVDYSKVTERFTKSKLMPSALYKIGLSFEALGMKEDAKSFYQELADKYPRSSEARLVRAKLK